MAYTKIMIGIPMTWNFMYGDFFLQFLRCQADWSGEYAPRVMIQTEHMLDDCRNSIVKEALDCGATHLWFWDADILPPVNALKTLMGHVNSGKDIVGLLCMMRTYPFYPIVFKENPKNRYAPIIIHDYEKGVIPAYATGTGCVMINTNVFRKMEYPWFKFEEDPNNPGEKISEDLYFCRKANDLGYKLYVDTIHTCGHLTTGPIIEPMYQQVKPRIINALRGAWVGKKKEVNQNAEKKIVYWGDSDESNDDNTVWKDKGGSSEDK